MRSKRNAYRRCLSAQNTILRSISLKSGQIFAPVVEFRGARVGVIRHILSSLKRSAVLQKHRDSGSPEGVIAEDLGQASRAATTMRNMSRHVNGSPVKRWSL